MKAAKKNQTHTVDKIVSTATEKYWQNGVAERDIFDPVDDVVGMLEQFCALHCVKYGDKLVDEYIEVVASRQVFIFKLRSLSGNSIE